VANVESHISDAVSKGAGIVLGCKRHALGGHFFEPTILRDFAAGMQVAREETFGPLAPLFLFRDGIVVDQRAKHDVTVETV
ncbi:aldehyde dehydrogenase family protein, partial [Rhizobium johnstonii]|uniref:aldehyde dehydrogenase family protein n=1 Tax=Rhizobium johnstonii TaxID=3019933 RepID=UPI003F994610